MFQIHIKKYPQEAEVSCASTTRPHHHVPKMGQAHAQALQQGGLYLYLQAANSDFTFGFVVLFIRYSTLALIITHRLLSQAK